jgi:hypothetical protein
MPAGRPAKYKLKKNMKQDDICKETQTNYSQSTISPKLHTVPPIQSKSTSNNIQSQFCDIKADTRDTIKFMSGEQTGVNSSLPSTTTIHPLPTRQERLKQFVQYSSAKDINEIMQEQFLPSVFTVAELRDSDDTPPQVRLQGAQIFINKVFPDKVEILQQKQIVDINKLIDQAMAIRSITQDKDLVDKSPVSCKDDNNE